MKIRTVQKSQRGKASASTPHSSEELFRGPIFSVARHRITEPGAVPAIRDIVHHRGSAVILPCLDDGSVVLVRQFRLAVEDFLWELPAGTIDGRESALTAARRELAEETGYRASSWRQLVEFFPSPGFLDEKVTLFLARKLRTGKARPEGDERIEIRQFPAEEWQSLIRSGQVRDAKTILGLLYLLCFRSRSLPEPRL